VNALGATNPLAESRERRMPRRGKPEWVNISFMVTAHAVAALAVIYLVTVRCSPWTVGLGIVWFLLSGLSISGGYHRLFAHRSYHAAAPVRFGYLLFAAAAVQNSALRWAADHRVHHAHTDSESDPYSIRRGFWWAHLGWVLFRNPDRAGKGSAPDLEADALIAFQHRYYLPIAIVFGALLPGALGFLWGDPIGALLVVGFLRLVVQWHVTFSINSFAHWIGRQPYCTDSTARDSGLTALISFGEGYHNFHHRFQADYRNGVRWWHFDPTKWLVWSLSWTGLTRDLTRTPAAAIAKARRLTSERARAVRSGLPGASESAGAPDPLSLSDPAPRVQVSLLTTPELAGRSEAAVSNELPVDGTPN
jgi:stearoyl-CoA desaturase (delta-9 desaturase)